MAREKLSNDQIIAIRKICEIGLEIQKEHYDDLVELRLNLQRTYGEIAEDLGLKDREDIWSEEAAIQVAWRAVNGSDGGFGSSVKYAGIADPNKLKEIGQSNSLIGARVAGERGRKTQKEQGLGIYAISPEDRRKNAAKGGKSISPEKRLEMGRKAAIAQGKVPYSPREIFEDKIILGELEFAMGATEAKTFQDKIGRPNWSAIACKVNEVYHGSIEVRNRTSLSSAVSRWKKNN